jgi:hypothetical protein
MVANRICPPSDPITDNPDTAQYTERAVLLFKLRRTIAVAFWPLAFTDLLYQQYLSQDVQPSNKPHTKNFTTPYENYH